MVLLCCFDVGRNRFAVALIENGFDLIIIADATAAAGDAAYEAALTNFEFLAHEVVTTNQIVKRLKAAK